MNKPIFILALIVTIITFSCRKKIKNPGPAYVIQKPEFSIGFFTPWETLSYKNPNSTDPQINYGDTLVKDSVFYFISPNPQTPRNNFLTVVMKLGYNKGVIRDVKWKVGNELNYRTGENISIDFSSPVGTIPVKCIYGYDTLLNGLQLVRVYDSLVKNITIGLLNNYQFTYLGYDTQNPADTFRVSIQYAPEPLIPSTQNKPYYNVKGLPQGYPYAVGIIPNNSVFAATDLVLYNLPRYLYANGNYYSHWFGNGYFRSNFDSVYINYSFDVRKNIVADSTNRTQNRVFVGKRVN